MAVSSASAMVGSYTRGRARGAAVDVEGVAVLDDEGRMMLRADTTWPKDEMRAFAAAHVLGVWPERFSAKSAGDLLDRNRTPAHAELRVVSPESVAGAIVLVTAAVAGAFAGAFLLGDLVKWWPTSKRRSTGSRTSPVSME
jgi:hypothetical protein